MTPLSYFFEKSVDLYLDTWYIVSSNKRKEVILIVAKSRADYFKKRRKDTKAFYVEIDREKMEIFEKKLSSESVTKKQWLDEKISEELKK